MGAIFDQINAEVAAREGLLAAAGVGRLHLIPARDRSRITQRTRNIRAIRNDAAAKLGVLPSQIIQADPDGRGLRDFRIDFHRKGGAIDPRGRYSIFATATDLSSKKRYVVGNAEHERLRTNAAPTGRRTANVIGTDELGQPIYEIVEDVRGALLSHLTAQVVRHLKPVIVGSAEWRALLKDGKVREWGSTVDTVFPDQDGRVLRFSADDTFANIRAGAGTLYNSGPIAGVVADGVTDTFQQIIRAPFEFDLSAYSAPDSAALLIKGGVASNSLADPTIHAVPSTAPVSTIAASDYAIANYTMTSKGSIAFADWTDSVYNSMALTLDLLNFGGVSKFAVVEDSDLNNSAPAWVINGLKRITWSGTATAGTDSDPHLELTTAAAAATGMSLAMKMALGVI